MDIIRIVKRIEWITSSRWWFLAALLIISAVIPPLAIAELFALAVWYWLTCHAEPEDATTADEGGPA